MNLDRRTLLAGGSAAVAQIGLAACTDTRAGGHAAAASVFPKGFLWGASTSGHQIEGNNVNSDLWLLENVTPTIFSEPSGDADNSFEMWPADLNLVQSLGLTSFRFSLEWARIEPEAGRFSIAMLDHYKAIIDGCRARAITPVVTFNHFTTPRWFAARGGWTAPDSPALFARFCDRSARHLAAGIGYATTLNEPNGVIVARLVIPEQVAAMSHRMLLAAARASGSAKYSAGNAAEPSDADVMTANLLAGHKMGRQAIKAARSDLPVGVSLAISEDDAAGPGSKRDAMRTVLYSQWLDAARDDDFIGVQNYDRKIWDARGLVPAPNTKPGDAGGAVYPPSLAAAVRYAHDATGLPVLVTENGIDTRDDTLRVAYIRATLHELKRAIDDGVPVTGYLHWSLLDNFEWAMGFKPRYGLCTVDRITFARAPKPSATVLGAIARQNAL